jgi:hypothetical protein
MMRSVSIDLSQVRYCAKCGSLTPPLCRHHKGFDSLVGIYNIGINRAYDKFRDCVDLCLDCHATIHFIYEPYVEQWVNRTPRGAAHFRKVLIGVCDKWLAEKIPTPKIPKSYLQKFRESFKEWQRSQGKLGTG